MGKFLHFLQYHNAVPIAVTILFVGAGATFAATNPEAIYSTTAKPLSVDNTYIANKDLATFSPKITIKAVTEDEDTYFVAYVFTSIDLKDYIWQDTSREDTMKVGKADLGQYRDLGVYVTGQFKQIIASENARLSLAQEDAKKQLSQKIVATEYGGLVGKFLDETTEVIPGYTPVVVAPEPEVKDDGQVAGIETSRDDGDTGSGSTGSSGIPTASSGGSGPALVVLGNNPAQIEIGARYADLGAVITDGSSDGLDITTFLDGKQVSAIAIDSSAPSQHVIKYVATTKKGTSWAERVVIVYDPALGPPVANPEQHFAPPPPPVPDTSTDTTSSSSQTSTTSGSTSTPTATTTSSTDTSATSTPPADSSTDTATSTPPAATDDSSQTAETPTDTSSTDTSSTATSTTP